MAGTNPIRLGSATGNTWTFETGSSLKTSASGLQSCAVKALFPNAETVFDFLPVAGISFQSLFGNSFLPASFLLDYTDGGPEIEYLEGKIARAVFQFKRIDPLSVNVRQVFTDSVLNYDSPMLQSFIQIIGGFIYQDGDSPPGAVTASFQGSKISEIGFPEPIVTVKYTSTSQPSIGATITSLYALPGTTPTQGFPAINIIEIPYTVPVPVGGSLVYFDGTAPVLVGPLETETTFNFIMNFRPNVLGWQLQRLKSDPVSARNFWDIEEEWRTAYFFRDVTFVGAIPPL